MGGRPGSDPMWAARVDDGAGCGQPALAVAAPHEQTVENARPRMKSRVHIAAHLWEFSGGRPIMQACLGITQMGIPKVRFALETCKVGVS